MYAPPLNWGRGKKEKPYWRKGKKKMRPD